MSAITPTCLPWQTHDDYEIEGRTTIIGNVDGEIHSDGTTTYAYDFVGRTLDLDDDSQSHSIAAANAAFIVLACNSHGELVACMIDLFENPQFQVAIGGNPNMVDALMDRARAAISKAKGEAL